MRIDFDLYCGCKGRYVDGLSTITVARRTCKLHKRGQPVGAPPKVYAIIASEERRMRVQLNLEYVDANGDEATVSIVGAPDSVPSVGEHISFYPSEDEDNPVDLTVVARYFQFMPKVLPDGITHVTLTCDLGHSEPVELVGELAEFEPPAVTLTGEDTDRIVGALLDAVAKANETAAEQAKPEPVDPPSKSKEKAGAGAGTDLA